MPKKRAAHKVYKLVGLQFFFASIVLLLWSFFNYSTTLDVAIGAAACLLPSLYFANRLYLGAWHANPKQMMRRFIWGEFFKLLLGAALIALALGFLHVNILAFFVGYISAHVGFWLAPLFIFNKARY